MKLNTLLLSGCLVVWLAYSCEENGPMSMDMPDPTDTIPMDTMPIVDTTWKVLINEIKGIYLGTCYIHNYTSMETFDTLFNITVTIDSLERIQNNGMYYYVLTDENGFFNFIIPEAEFVQDTIYIHAVGPSQRYSKTFQFIRSQRFLYSKRGVYPGFGFMVKKCYCTKQ